ncbi:hypothetical protein PCE1_003574 [Barthelona sp. PCE]
MLSFEVIVTSLILITFTVFIIVRLRAYKAHVAEEEALAEENRMNRIKDTRKLGGSRVGVRGSGKKPASKQTKVSKSRMLKDQLKEERRRNREARLAAQRDREEKERKDMEKERERKEEQARLDEIEQERIRKIEQEKERQEQEEFEKWKDSFTVQTEGTLHADIHDEDDEKLSKFINYIKDARIVTLEDLATEFNMIVEEIVNRLNQMLNYDMISGVFDDRGRFFYVSKEDFEHLADFITEKGRVSIREITTELNIRLSQ